MAQQANQTEARTETTTLGMTSMVVPVGLEAIAKKMKGGDNKTAALHLGEDSATPFHMETTLTVGGETSTFIESGMFEVAASYQRSSTTALPLTAILHELGGVNSPQARKVINTALEAAVMRAAGADADTVAKHYETNKVKWSADTERKNSFLKRLRAATVRTVSAAVKVVLD